MSNYVKTFWKRLEHESTSTFMVVPEDRYRTQLRPYVELGHNLISVGPSSAWSELQTENIKMFVEDGPSRCVWLAVKPKTTFVSDIIAAYDNSNSHADLLAELPYDFERSALEAALRANSGEFVFCPGAEEPIILVPGAVVQA